MKGPGRYDDLCTYAREQADAQGVILIILEGKVGSGCSMQLSSSLDRRGIPGALRDMANEIEAEEHRKEFNNDKEET
jgi:hypothetical protein